MPAMHLRKTGISVPPYVFILKEKNVGKNCKIHEKFENVKIPYKNLEKYGSFSEFRTSTEKSVMLATSARTTGNRN